MGGLCSAKANNPVLDNPKKSGHERNESLSAPQVSYQNSPKDKDAGNQVNG